MIPFNEFFFEYSYQLYSFYTTIIEIFLNSTRKILKFKIFNTNNYNNTYNIL